MPLNWKIKKADLDKITKIVLRAAATMGLEERGSSKMELSMDIHACHCNGNPLDLGGLLAADQFNFSHDIVGIIYHINRNDGSLSDCFMPRYSDVHQNA
jgi:hypothetical protein